MTTRLVPEVLVVDPLDRELEQLLSACGMRTTRGTRPSSRRWRTRRRSCLTSSSWTPAARAAIPPSMAAVKRQHPDVGFLVVASESDPQS